jgi:hypothetical protein
MPSKSVGMSAASCRLWMSPVRLLTKNSGITTVKQSMTTLRRQLIIGWSLSSVQASLLHNKPVDIPTASCRLQKSPVWFLTNNGLFPNTGIAAVKHSITALSGLDSILIDETSLCIRPFLYPVKLSTSLFLPAHCVKSPVWFFTNTGLLFFLQFCFYITVFHTAIFLICIWVSISC